jgi:hypothetical protein
MAVITTAEKSKGKREILKIVTPFLIGAGFTKIGTGDFSYPQTDGVGRLLLNVPTFEASFRMFSSFEARGHKFAGPHTLPFECPNPPGGRRYYFRFTFAEETYPRCAKEMIDWVSFVLIPWFQSQPSKSWSR